MLRELALAIGIPLGLLLLAVLALEQWHDQMPPWLQRLSEWPSWLWNTGIGLIIGLGVAALAAAAPRLDHKQALKGSKGFATCVPFVCPVLP